MTVQGPLDPAESDSLGASGRIVVIEGGRKILGPHLVLSGDVAFPTQNHAGLRVLKQPFHTLCEFAHLHLTEGDPY